MSQMNNIVYRLQALNKSFTYLHSHVFTQDTLDMVRSAGRAFEVDVSIGPDGNLFIGHHMEYYKFNQMELPTDHVSVADVIDLAQIADLFIVIDCKDERALPEVERIIEAYGNDRVLFHSWVDVFKFEPYPEELVVEPQWLFEDLPYDKVVALKQKTGVPVISSARGLTHERLNNDRKYLDRIIQYAKGNIDVMNFSLPNNEPPNKAVIDELLANDLLTLINIDRADKAALPDVFIGITDRIADASSPGDFD